MPRPSLRWPTIKTRDPVLLAAASVWALLFGMLMLMLGNGLQGTLIGVRATDEAFAANVVGLIMSAYFVGFLAGSRFTPFLITQVGHLRVFAALASLSSVSILVHSLLVDPWVWVGMRVITGFAFAGIYIVTESWLNDRVTNEHRGGLLSIYMIVSYAGLTGGQLLLNIADPGLHDLFIIIAILVSVAAVPILLVVTQTPKVQEWSALGPRQLFRESHLGAVGAVTSGVVIGAILGMGPVYAASTGMTIGEISLFMAAVIGAGAVAQWPIGRYSDRLDRRKVILGATLIGGLAALLAATLTLLLDHSAARLMSLMGAVVGAAGLALYPLFAAYTNDRVRPDQMVGAGSSLIMLYGAGAIAGPLLAGEFMQHLGPSGFFWLLAVTMLGLAVFTVWRIRHGRPIKISEQSRWAHLQGLTRELLPAWLDTVLPEVFGDRRPPKADETAGDTAARQSEPSPEDRP